MGNYNNTEVLQENVTEDSMSNKNHIENQLTKMGYSMNYIESALNEYENHGKIQQNITFDMEALINIITRLQKIDNNETVTELAGSIWNPVSIDITVTHQNYGKLDGPFSCKFKINATYSKQETINTVLNAANKYLAQKFHPTKLKITSIVGSKSFNNISISPELQSNQYLLNKSLTLYNKINIMNEGLYLKVKVKEHQHTVSSQPITCKYMISKQTTDPTQCPFYVKMKQNYEWSKENLNHLNNFTHFQDEYGEKTGCRYNESCKAYKRLESGGNTITDICHVKLYKHPPRSRNIKLAENINALIINKKEEQNRTLYTPSIKHIKQYNDNESNGFLYALIKEVELNGFKYDLCLECGMYDECKHSEYSILQIVDEKMDCHRHKVMGRPLNRGEMLSLILYTGCDCNYELCKSQRNGDYNKWKWFDYCLYNAIYKLSEREIGSFKVFSGLNKVKLDKKSVDCGYFVTYVSTSWKKDVAESFMNEEGMIIEINKQFKNLVLCCDVSWISKFPDECEILFARSTDLSDGKFKCAVLDHSNGIQTVSLRKRY